MNEAGLSPRGVALSSQAPAAQVTAQAPADTAETGERLRVLVTSHSHPRLTNGGAEIAAYALFRGLQTQGTTAAWFLGCSSKRTEARAGSCISQPFGDAEYIYDPTTEFDYFKCANPDPEFPRALGELITTLTPNVVHAHHYAVFGVEMFRGIKKLRPRTKIFLTLHEYQAICYNNGQMVKTNTNRLCRRESLIDCHTCFPHIPAQDFFLRKEYFIRFFSAVDRFIAPSHFLASRYIEWGLPEAKIVVLENLMPRRTGQAALPADEPLSAARCSRPRLRVGFFGQMSPLKGIKVLTDTAKVLHERRVRGVSFDVFGDYTGQPAEFQNAVLSALSGTGANVVYHGPYENEDVDRLMRTVDLVLVPSIWWENSPVVIREALYNRRPVICSNVGGMAEKVRPGLDGLHFTVGDAPGLATLLEDMMASPETLEKLQASIETPSSTEAGLQQYIQAYLQVLVEEFVL